MKIGYVRVSSREQNLNLQNDAMKEAQVQKIFEDKASGKNTARPGLKTCLESLNSGDTLYIWKLDRLGRSLKDLLQIVDDLEARGIALHVITEPGLNTSTPTGKLLFNLMGSFANYEREIIRERIQAGTASAKERGVKFGRKRALSNAKWEALNRTAQESSIAHACKLFEVSRSTYYLEAQRRGSATAD